MSINAIIADPRDFVVTLTAGVEKDALVSYYSDDKVKSVKANEAIPQYHKIATCDIKRGQAVIKYGEVIGLAKEDIHAGDYVHTHNLSSDGR